MPELPATARNSSQSLQRPSSHSLKVLLVFLSAIVSLHSRFFQAGSVSMPNEVDKVSRGSLSVPTVFQVFPR